MLWFSLLKMTTAKVVFKFLAERLVLDPVAHHGLSAKVMRVGNLSPLYQQRASSTRIPLERHRLGLCRAYAISL